MTTRTKREQTRLRIEWGQGADSGRGPGSRPKVGSRGKPSSIRSLEEGADGRLTKQRRVRPAYQRKTRTQVKERRRKPGKEYARDRKVDLRAFPQAPVKARYERPGRGITVYAASSLARPTRPRRTGGTTRTGGRVSPSHS